VSNFNSYFTDPCELVAVVYAADGITELGCYSFRGYAKNMNRFFQICNLFAWEMTPSNRYGKDSDFQIYLDTIRDFYYAYVKDDKLQDIEAVLREYIVDLKQYKFKSRRLFFLLAYSDAESRNYREFEITIDRIFKWILKMRQYRIEFYERVLQEYKARKDQYNQRLRTHLECEDICNSKKLVAFSVESALTELGVEPENDNYNVFPEMYFEIHNKAWYLADLLKLDNPSSELERYTKRIPLYRTVNLHADPKGLKAFFELFSIFRVEMSFILPDNPDDNFFERVLTVLKRDFLDDFEQQGDLEDVIAAYIEHLEKFEFLSLHKEQFYDRLSKMIYSLRTRRIAFYEAMLEDYLANKEKYDKAM
jgi:hypothetical protein